MKTKIKLIFVFILLFHSSFYIQAQDKKTFEGPRWRAGLVIQYASNFKNLQIDYSSLGYTGLLGGYSGRGLEIFGGYKIHKYVALELAAGLLLNSYNRSYDQSVYILGRFNKIYVHPSVKFSYPVINKDFGTINAFIAGGLGLNGSGRLYLEERDYYDKYVTYARYDPMLAPFATVGAELLFTDRSNLLIGIKYQNGSFTANKYYESYDAAANIKNAPAEIKTINAQGIAIMLGFIQEF